MKPARLTPPASSLTARTYPAVGGHRGFATGVSTGTSGTSATAAPVATPVAAPAPVFPTFPALHAHYNGQQPHLGMFSLWELRIKDDPAERTIASVMADAQSHEQWLRLFLHAPALLEHCLASHSNCQHWRRELARALEELSCIPGLEDVTHRLSAVQTEMLKAAATLDATAQQVEGPPDGAVPAFAAPTPTTTPVTTSTTPTTTA